jgi:hypothetical protein
VQQCLWPSSAQPPEVWKGSLDYSASDPFNPLQPASRAQPTRRPARGPSGLYAHWLSSASVPCMPRGPRVLCWWIKDVSLYDPHAYGPHTFFTTGFPRFLSIRGARGLQAFDQQRHTSY